MRLQAARVAEMLDLAAWSDWFSQLDRTFIFLLVLPFVVAIVGLWAAIREGEDEREKDEE